MAASLTVVGGIAGDLHRPRGLDVDGVVAGRAFDIVEIEAHGAVVAIEQEARQRRGQHHGIAHRDIGGGAAELGRGPRHRHHPRGAGELRNVEADFGGAVGGDRDDAGIQRQRLLRRRAALQLGAGGIAAGLELAARALHAVDQLPVEVADFRGQAALAEIIVVRRRRLVIGQIENADIDRGNDDLGVLAGIEPAELDRNLQRGVRAAPAPAATDSTLQRARLLVDAEPFQADGPAGHPQRGGIERPAQGRHHIGAGAPILADRNFDLRGAFLDVGGLRRQQPVAEHVDGQLAGGARVDRHHHGVAGLVFRLVDRGFQQIGRVGAAVGIPADVELHRGQRAVGLGRFDVEPIAAGLRRQRRSATACRRRWSRSPSATRLVDLTGSYSHGRILPIPLIAGFHLQQLVAQAVARQRLAVGRDEHHVEIGLVAFRDALVAEQRLDADHRAGRRDRQHQLALDGAAAGFRHADEDLGLLRPGRGRRLGQADREGRNAVGVGLRQVLDRRALVAGGLLVGDAELVAGIARPRLAAGATSMSPSSCRPEAGAP